MNYKSRFIILSLIVIIALAAMFALAGAAVQSENDELAFMPVILLIKGTPQPTNTPMPVTATATPIPTATMTPTPTPIPRHFEDCAFRTGSNATIAVPAGVTINGPLEMAVDDEIAVFTPDGSICAGTTPWDGDNIAITAWGDNSQTDEVDGLQAGEEMVFHIWDKSENEEIIVAAVSYSLGNGLFSTDGIYAVQSFTLE